MEIKRKPNWLRIAVSQGSNFTKTFETILSSGVDTVCQNAKCPIGAVAGPEEPPHLCFGRHLHPRLRLLRRRARNAPCAQSRRTLRRCKCRGKTRPEMRRHHLGNTRRYRRRRGGALGKNRSCHTEEIARHENRNFDSVFAATKPRSKPCLNRAPTFFRTMWKPSSVCKNPYAKRPITKLRSACLPPPANTACVSKAP